MRIYACLLLLVIVLAVVPAKLLAGDANATSNADTPAVSSARSLPAISVLDREAQESVSLAADLDAFDDSPLDFNLVLLAAWLPIAGALLALAMDGSADSRSRAARPSLWVE